MASDDDEDRPSASDIFDMQKGAGSSTASSGPRGTAGNRGLGPGNAAPGVNLGEGPSDPTKTPSPFTEVGASGLAQYGGFVRDEFLPQLQGDRGLKVWREMYDNDPVIGALVFAIQMLIRKVEWRVEPPVAASVEGIVAEREAERAKQLALSQQAQQLATQQAQAGLAGNSTAASHTMTGPDGKPVPGALQRKPVAPPDFASPTQKPPPPHLPLNGPGAAGPTPAPNGAPNVPPVPGIKPTPLTAPGNNAPVTPNAPGTNPRGGPAQDAAAVGQSGLPSGGDPRKRQKLGTSDGDVTKSLNPWKRFRKAGSGGGSVGGIDAMAPDGTDPETNLPLEFPIGLGPESVSTPEQRKAEELAVFVETCLHDTDTPWSDLLSQILTMIVFGFAYHEIVYKKRNGPNPDFPEQGSRYNDGRIGWAKLAGRAQETRHRWEFDENGQVLGMWQLAPPHFVLKYIPMQKALLFRTTAWKANPEGRSLIRSAYRPWFFKRRIEEIEAIGVERDLAGLPIAYVPYEMMTPNATAEEQATLAEIKKLVRNIRRDEQDGVVFPMAIDPESKQKMYELTLLGQGAGKRQFDTDKIIVRYEQRMAMTVLADFILFGHGDASARSLGETKADMFTTALESLLNAIADVFNTYAIPKLLQMNGEDPARSPKLTFGKLTRVSLTEISAFITAMATAGADLFPDVQLEDHLREIGGLPPKAASDNL